MMMNQKKDIFASDFLDGICMKITINFTSFNFQIEGIKK